MTAFPRRAMATMITRVATTVSGVAEEGTPSGISFSMSKATGITVTAISMMTVPDTVGVRMRRSSDSRPERRNWNSDAMITSVPSMAGPPLEIAAMQTAMKVADVPITST